MLQSVLSFWFEEIKPAQWWKVDPDFDQLIRSRFSELHACAARAELFEWRQDTPKDKHDFELRHKAIIDRFGRYPNRNIALGRESTPDELAFLKEPGSRF